MREDDLVGGANKGSVGGLVSEIFLRPKCFLNLILAFLNAFLGGASGEGVGVSVLMVVFAEAISWSENKGDRGEGVLPNVSSSVLL